MKTNAISPMPSASVTTIPSTSAIQPLTPIPLSPMDSQLRTLTTISTATTIAAIAATSQVDPRRMVLLAFALGKQLGQGRRVPANRAYEAAPRMAEYAQPTPLHGGDNADGIEAS